MIIFFFHLSFLLKNYKEIENKDNLQKFFDFSIRQLELSIREIGYSDATINKKMKDYINLLFSLVDKIDNWESLQNDQKLKIIKNYVNDVSDYNVYLDYIEKYRSFLAKNPFNNLSKDIINL